MRNPRNQILCVFTIVSVAVFAGVSNADDVIDAVFADFVEAEEGKKDAAPVQDPAPAKPVATSRPNRPRQQTVSRPPTDLADQVVPVQFLEPQLTMPSPEELLKTAADIQGEIERLRNEGAAEAAATLENDLLHLQAALETGSPLPPHGEGPELHVVGIRQGIYTPEVLRRGEPHPQGVAEVHVDCPNREIVLALCALEPVKWKLSVADGSKLVKVLVSADHPQEVEGLPDGAELVSRDVLADRGKAFFAYTQDYHFYPRMVRALWELTGLKITTFQGGFAYAGTPFQIGGQSKTWREQQLLARFNALHDRVTRGRRVKLWRQLQLFRFTAITETTSNNSTVLAEFAPAGPISWTKRSVPHVYTHITDDPQTDTKYAIDGNRVVLLESESQQHYPLEFDGSLPRPSGLCGLTFDARRQRLIVASHDEAKRLYAYVPTSGQWSLLAESKVPAYRSIAYDYGRDALFGIDDSRWAVTSIHKFSPNGESMGKIQLSQPIMVGDGGTPKIVPAGKYLLVLAPPIPNLSAQEPAEVAYSYVVDSETGQVVVKALRNEIDSLPPIPAEVGELSENNASAVQLLLLQIQRLNGKILRLDRQLQHMSTRPALPAVPALNTSERGARPKPDRGASNGSSKKNFRVSSFRW